MALMDGNLLLKLTHSFTLRALTHVFPMHFSPLQTSQHCSIMWHLISWTPRAQWSPNHLKLVTVYVLMLLVSLSFASGQSRPFKHQIDNRSPEIDPFWYVGRGVRPIGRFGKRQLRSSHSSLRPVSRHLDFILNALWEQKSLDTEDSDW
ncbi:LOW QUALITY PROTEIN: uncharacterized protein LOC110471064 [Lonchura striata]